MLGQLSLLLQTRALSAPRVGRKLPQAAATAPPPPPTPSHAPGLALNPLFEQGDLVLHACHLYLAALLIACAANCLACVARDQTSILSNNVCRI